MGKINSYYGLLGALAVYEIHRAEVFKVFNFPKAHHHAGRLGMAQEKGESMGAL